MKKAKKEDERCVYSYVTEMGDKVDYIEGEKALAEAVIRTALDDLGVERKKQGTNKLTPNNIDMDLAKAACLWIFSNTKRQGSLHYWCSSFGDPDRLVKAIRLKVLAHLKERKLQFYTPEDPVKGYTYQQSNQLSLFSKIKKNYYNWVM